MLSSPPLSKVHCAACSLKNCSGFVLYQFGDVLAECSSCKVKQNVLSLGVSTEVKDISMALALFWRLFASKLSKPVGSPVTKVLGLSSFYCKLLSPLLTCYGIDKTGKAKTIQELKNCAIFDCSWLGSRSFSIEPEHLDVPGYGRDESGSAHYLSGTLSLLRSYNNNRDTLIPLHVDGDGHCLVHAVSRAIVGRELFWHPLRTGLKHHLVEHLPRYKALLSDFINSSEWDDIIAECDPDYAPSDNEMHGLRNIHIFGLSNVLRRPILLLDSVAGMQSSGDYSALFLPKLVPPSECRDSSGTLFTPICLAWSSSGRNHYIPLVGVRGCDPPVFPHSLLPKAWGVPQSAVKDYLEFNQKDCLVIGGRALPDTYLLKLTSGIAALYRQKHGVDPGLVADVYYSNFKKTVFGIHPKEVSTATKTALQERRLYRCLSCGSVNLQPLSSDWLRPHGLLYNLAKKQTKGGMLEDQHIYTFHSYGVSCIYDGRKDVLVVEKSTHSLDTCSWCYESKLRLIRIDGSTVYENGDKTSTVVDSSKTHCQCGFKHWYNGREYDNPPQKITISFEWKSRIVTDEVLWFKNESDSSLNSSVHQAAAIIIHKYFPGEGNPILRTILVEKILEKVNGGNNMVPSDCSSKPCPPSSDSSRDHESSSIKTMIEPETISKQELGDVPGNPKSKDEAANVQHPTLTAKKRPCDSGGGAVPKQRSLPASLAAAAAISRAQASLSGEDSTTTRGVCNTPSKNLKPVQMMRLGPGYSVMATPSEIPKNHQATNEALLQKYEETSELLLNRFGLLASAVVRNKDKCESEPSNRTVASRQLEPSYGSLSRLAHLLNVAEMQNDDFMSWSEEEDPM